MLNALTLWEQLAWSLATSYLLLDVLNRCTFFSLCALAGLILYFLSLRLKWKWNLPSWWGESSSQVPDIVDTSSSTEETVEENGVHNDSTVTSIVKLTDLLSTLSGTSSNPEKAIPFENALFEGKVLFMLKDDDALHWQHLFSGRRRLFWIQIQGRFRIVPISTVFVGGEVQDRMQLGLWTRQLCRAILSLLKTLLPGLHSSLGDATGNERPHISFPLYNSMEEFIVTPGGETPPQLGQDGFGESDADRKERRKGYSKQHPYVFNTTDTYSFQFHNYFLNFIQWSVVNLPGLSDFSLTSVWKNMPLRIVAYQVDPENESSNSSLHECAKNQYFFNFELSHRRFAPSCRKSTTKQSDKKPRRATAAHIEQLRIAGAATALDSITFSIPYWLHYYCPLSSEARIGYVFHAVETSRETGSKILGRFTILQSVVTASAPVLSTMSGKIKYKMKKGRWSKIESQKRFIEKALHAAQSEGGEEIKANIYGLFYPRGNNTRPSGESEVEYTRPQNCLHEVFFTTFGSQSPRELKISTDGYDYPTTTIYQGEVLRLCWQSHLSQEWIVVGKTSLNFFTPRSKSPILVIPMKDVTEISSKGKDDEFWLSPFFDVPGVTFVQVTTCYKVFTFAVPSQEEADQILTLNPAGRERVQKLITIPFSQTLEKNQEQWTDFIEPSYKYKDFRRILNARGVESARSPCQEKISSKVLQDPCRLLSQLLGRTLSVDITTTGTSTVLDILKTSSLLTLVSLESLCTDEHRLAFFLNLFHMIIMHARLLRILPTTKFLWSKFFNEVSYEVGPHVFSLAEIEHCVLRSQMHAPRLPYASLLLPSFSTGDLRKVYVLHSSDFRINLALNWTSKSCMDSIIVFHPDNVNKQMNDACRHLIHERVQVDLQKVMIALPKICDWYRKDFGKNAVDIVQKLLPFLREENHDVVSHYMHDSKMLRIKYIPFDYTFHANIKECPPNPLLVINEEL